MFGEVKGCLILEPKRKQHVRNTMRDAVRKCGKSDEYYPKPVDLFMVRVKCRESCMEAQSVAVSKRSCEL